MNKAILNRVAYVLVAALFFVSLANYYVVEGEGSLAILNFMQDPEKYAGEKREIMGQYSHSTYDGFVMLYNKQSLSIHYEAEYAPPKYGQVLVYGTLREDGTIDAIGVHNYNYNYWIYVASFFAGLYVLKVFFNEWKITWRGFQDA